MNQLSYTQPELLGNHIFAAPHIIDGQRMHGGFDADGHYVPPRALGRAQALTAWTEALRARGGELFEADSSLLAGVRVPNLAQHLLLLRAGHGQTFWNGLTITGKIEARGRVLAQMQFPDLRKLVTDDIETLSIGHLDRGLLLAHGIDEGGEPDKGIGGHDVMWFVARDLAFGPKAFPDVDPPASISRPDTGKRVMPEIAPEYEGMLAFLMNLLVIEFRAEIGFAGTQAILRTPDLFADRRPQAEAAALIIERIRTDETIHIQSLRLYLGELREMSFCTVDGGAIAGRVLIDRFWRGLIHWATVEQPRLAAAQQREQVHARLRDHPQGEALLREFDALADIAA
ncbi:MAG TPA: hypothetical protein PK359_17175 [Burkholderiaceae bacterium]|jgi:hypothetical protein|nr:hypothetical protein [Burkholderiaceae bacterium]